MPFIATVTDAEASDAVAELFDTDRARVGYVRNYTRLFAHRPAVYAAWRQLLGAVTESMDPRRYELATVAVARTLSSSYCMLAHGKVLRDEFYEHEALRKIAFDHRSAGLDEIDVAIMDFAEKVAGDATAITQADVDRLRGLGLSDAEVLDVTLAAAARCFSKTLDGLGLQADATFSELDPELRAVLTVGRPIAES
jgi:uncharacterized peroxidase-related enzyme